LLFALAFVLYAVPVLAQTGIPTAWTLKVYNAGTSISPYAVTVPIAQVTCNQATAPGAGSGENTIWSWDDPVNAGKFCSYVVGTSSLPDGNYEGTAVASNADGVSAESARIPFTRRRPNPPAAPTGLRITP
jgi:hypothetical protein